MSESITKTRKEQIMDVTAKLFREKGFAASSMREIATGLNIEAASLYHHIKSKDELLETICFEMAHKFISALHEVNDIYFNAEEKLRMAIKNHVRIMTSNIDRSVVFFSEWRHLTEPRLAEFKDLRHTYEKEMHMIIEQGQNENVFDEVDTKFATLTIFSSVNWIYQWYDPEGEISPEEIATKISDFLLNGLRKKSITDMDFRP
ncbi:MAG: TetR/AcrR family transcriptional regulator [Bacteroidia bacterium]